MGRVRQKKLAWVLSGEGAEACDGLADDQILDLIGAFVGVEGFAIRERTSG